MRNLKKQLLLKSNLSLLHLEQLFFFCSILFLPTQLGKHFWPDFSLVYSLRIDYLSPTIYIWDLIVIGLLLISFIRKSEHTPRGMLVLLIFLLTQLISLFGSGNILGGLIRFEQYVLTAAFGFYIASLPLVSYQRKLFYGLIACIWIEAFITTVQFLKGGSLGLWILGERTFSLSTPSIATFNWYGQIFLRPYATFPHPNVLAAFFVISLPIIIFLSSQLKEVKHGIPAFFYKGALGLSFISVVLSFSRTAIIVLLVETIFLLRKNLRVLLILIFILLPLLFLRFQTAFTFDILSVTRREELAVVAIEQFLTRPSVGIGLNNFINMAESTLISGPSRFLQPVHNIFLLTLAETGIVGFGGLLLLLFYPLVLLRKVADKRVVVLILFLFSSVIFLGMLDHYFLTLPQGLRLLFLIWGFSLSLIFSTINQDGKTS